MKNKFMRIAAILMMLVILTATAVSGTVAKYITSSTVSDKAVIAYWGFSEGHTDINIFDHTDAGTTVAADRNGVKVIAPGTKGSATLKFVFTEGANGITAPEVAYRFTASVTAEGGAGGFGNNSLTGPRFGLKIDGQSIDMGDGVWGSFNDLSKKLELAITGSEQVGVAKDYNPGELPGNINKSIEIIWEWPFDADPERNIDDEMLTSSVGNMAGTFEPFVITITTTAVQID